MIKNTVYFNGVDITNGADITNIVRPSMPSRPKTKSVPGRDGEAFIGTNLDPKPISFDLVFRNCDPYAQRTVLDNLAAALHVDEPKQLKFTDEGSKYYMAILDGEIESQPYANAIVVSLKFKVPDPVRYEGATPVSATIVSVATVAITGTYPTKPTIATATAAPGQSGYWGVRVDGGDYMHVQLTSGTHSVSINCETRVVTVDGDPDMITLDSDWFELAPGNHTITNDVGTCTNMTLNYFPRWL